MKKRDGLLPVGRRQSRSNWLSRMAGTVSVGLCWLAKRRAAPLFGEKEAALCLPTAVGSEPPSAATRWPPSREPGREAAEADRDALYLAYRLLNVHVHLLSVVDPCSIQGAVVCDGIVRRETHSAHGRMPDAGTKRDVEDAARPKLGISQVGKLRCVKRLVLLTSSRWVSSNQAKMCRWSALALTQLGSFGT